MEVQQQGKKPTRVQRKKKPIKVKYISSPMNIETSASRFRSLVQELTGQYAGDLPTNFRGAVVPEVSKITNSVEENLVMEGTSNELVADYFSPFEAEDFTFEIDEKCSGYFPAGVYSVDGLESTDSV